jgi:hypothetical protein
MKNIDREGSMWQILNILTPSDKKRFRENSPEYLLPLTDERINTVFPKDKGPTKDGVKDKSTSK